MKRLHFREISNPKAKRVKLVNAKRAKGERIRIQTLEMFYFTLRIFGSCWTTIKSLGSILAPTTWSHIYELPNSHVLHLSALFVFQNPFSLPLGLTRQNSYRLMHDCQRYAFNVRDWWRTTENFAILIQTQSVSQVIRLFAIGNHERCFRHDMYSPFDNLLPEGDSACFSVHQGVPGLHHLELFCLGLLKA